LLAAFAHGAVQVIAAASVFLALAAVWLRQPSRHVEHVTHESGSLGLASWLRELRARGQVCIGVLSVARRSARVARVAQALLAANPGLRVARYGRKYLLLMAAADSAPSLAQLVAASGGTLEHAWLSASCQGVDSIGIARARGVLPRELHAALCPSAQELCVQLLIGEFRRGFPAGTLLDLVAGTGALGAERLPRASLGEFVQQVVAASQQRERERGRLPLALAVYAPAGRAVLLFVVAQATPGFAAFQARVWSASLHASFYLEPRALTRERRAWRLGPGIDRAAPP
jgi:hypothetical protein